MRRRVGEWGALGISMGAGLGAADFTWSAALAIDLLATRRDA